MDPICLLKVSLNREEFYAGDQIIVNLQFTSRLTQTVRILAIQLAGFCTINRELVDESKMEPLRKMPSYLLNSSLGGGRITATATPKHRPDWIPIYSTPPSVIAADIQLGPDLNPAYEWRLTIDKSALPSYSGKSARIYYKLIISVDCGPKKSDSFETYIKVLSPYIPDRSADLYPLHSYDVMVPYSTFEDLSESWVIKTGDTELSPKERLRRGEQITMDMIVKYHQSGSRKASSLTPSKSPSQECYSLLIENHIASNFDVKRDQQKIASLTVSKTMCRAGELVFALLDFKDAELTTFQLRAELEEYEVLRPEFSKTGLEVETESHVLSAVDQIVWQRNKTSFRLGLPLRSSSSMYTSLYEHRYRLRLTLWVADGKSYPGNDQIPKWLGCTPDTPFVERFEFSIPIAVLPFPSAPLEVYKCEFAF